jgi:hypothetical protein
MKTKLHRHDLSRSEVAIRGKAHTRHPWRYHKEDSMSIDQELMQQSLNRCGPNENFVDRFYETFLASSPAIRKKFAQTDWDRQLRMMTVSLLHMTKPNRIWDLSDEALRNLAIKHGAHGEAIPAWMYDNWLASLLSAAKQCDPEFDSETENAWLQTLAKGIAFMKANYQEPPEPA